METYTVNKQELEHLVACKLELESLEDLGIENFTGYDERLQCEDLDEAVDDYIKCTYEE